MGLPTDDGVDEQDYRPVSLQSNHSELQVSGRLGSSGHQCPPPQSAAAGKIYQGCVAVKRRSNKD